MNKYYVNQKQYVILTKFVCKKKLNPYNIRQGYPLGSRPTKSELPNEAKSDHLLSSILHSKT